MVPFLKERLYEMPEKEFPKVNVVNYIAIVDRDFNIVFDARYEKRINKHAQIINREEYQNRKFFEVYPDIQEKNSTVAKCINTGKVIFRENQKVTDFWGRTICSDSITIPIICEGQVMGAIELAKDVTTVGWNQSEQENEVNTEKPNQITFSDVLTKNPTMLDAIEKAKFMAHLPNPTLIYGETGTGKELFSQAMITEAGVDRRKVVVQNCAAIPENLFESILFGTEKGVYTGAENKKGLFEEANQGILFLDELNAMPYSVQGKLLRVLQNGTFRKLGSSREQKVKVKVIAAMNFDPIEAMEQHIIRPDLFYRFSSGMIYIPPLRDRLDDLDYYLEHFRLKLNEDYGKNVKKIDGELKSLLQSYRWEGNVRELKHMLESMIAVSKTDKLEVNDLPKYAYDKMIHKDQERDFFGMEKERLSVFDKNRRFDLRQVLEEKEKNLIIEALEKVEGNHSQASVLLGIPRATLTYKMKKLGIE